MKVKELLDKLKEIDAQPEDELDFEIDTQDCLHYCFNIFDVKVVVSDLKKNHKDITIEIV